MSVRGRAQHPLRPARFAQPPDASGRWVHGYGVEGGGPPVGLRWRAAPAGSRLVGLGHDGRKARRAGRHRQHPRAAANEAAGHGSPPRAFRLSMIRPQDGRIHWTFLLELQVYEAGKVSDFIQTGLA
jgi:hypothetical protein